MESWLIAPFRLHPSATLTESQIVSLDIIKLFTDIILKMMKQGCMWN